MSAATISASTPFRLQLLGSPRLIGAGRELRFPDRRSIALLALLAIDGALARERVATLLWDVQGDTDARRNLRRELHRMRESGIDAVLESRGETLALRGDVELDTVAFQRACADNDAQRALALHGTGLLPGFELNAAPGFNDWLAARREALAQAWRARADAHARLLQAAGDLRGALAVAQALIAQDQLQEAHYRRAMELHARLGEREAALDAYERCRRALGRELGLRPLAATTDLAERIRSGQSVALAPAAHAAASAALEVTLPELTSPVGRQALLEQIEARLASEKLIVVEGVAGVGKSTLLRVLREGRPARALHEARASDTRVPFAALVRWLRGGLGAPHPALAESPTWVVAELARLLPELGVAPPPIATDAQRLRFYEALRVAWQTCFAITEAHLFDDWQFVDDASAEWWTWWQDHGRDVPVLVALRPDEARPEASTALAEAARAHGAAALTVPALDDDAMFALVQRLSGVARPRRFAQRLRQATGGNPFFAIETLRHLFEEGVIRVDAEGQWATPFDEDTADYRELPIPPSVHAAIGHRVRTLDEPTRRLLEAASLTGDDFRLELVSGATALGDWEAVAALETALRARIVGRHPDRAGLYRFEHDLFAQVIAAGLSPERAALMHRALGHRLAQGEADPARVADHFERGGDRPAAQRHRLQALESARRRHAVSDMIEQSERLLALQPPTAAALTAHLAAATAWRARADAPRAQQALACAEALVREDDPPELHVQLLLGRAAQAQSDGRSSSMQGPISARLADPRLAAYERGRLLQARGDALRAQGRVAESLTDLHGALAAFGDEPSLARGHLLESLARSGLAGHDLSGALVYAERALEVMRALDHPSGVASASMLAGVVHLQSGRLADALPLLEEARRIAHAHGLISSERGAILNLVPVLLAQGRTRDALLTLEQGFALSSLFSSRAEEGAFLEARYHCRVVAGELGDALEARPALIASSLAVGDRYRMLSGLLVASDLPLTLGDLHAAADGIDAVLAVLAEDTAGGMTLRARCTVAWLALERGNPAEARRHLNALGATRPQRNEEQVWLLHVRIRLARVVGQLQEARAALNAPRDNVAPDTWALYLAAALTVDGSDGRVDAGTLAAAQRDLVGALLPPLSALLVIDALTECGEGEPWHDEGARLFATLRQSLAQHPRELALFERRFSRLS
ncbi:MAG: BTAD domain-containing putative transcriptional regulator [Caldimonas sp.]